MNQENCELKTPACLIADYSFIRLLGEGTSGRTYLALRRADNSRVAIKALKFDSTFKSMELFEREAETLSGIIVDGVPKFYGYVKSEDSYGEAYLIQEYVEYPSLQFCLDKGRVFSEMEVIHIVRRVVEILKHLEKDYTPPIIHRDIKPSNILFDEISRKCVLIDFGAVANPQRKSAGSTVAGTMGFMAPEQLMGDCTIQSDYYALGATALNLLSRVSPADMKHAKDDPFKIDFEQYLPKTVSENTKEMLGALLAVKSAGRPKNIEEINENYLDKYQEEKEHFKKQYIRLTQKNKAVIQKVNFKRYAYAFFLMILGLTVWNIRSIFDLSEKSIPIVLISFLAALPMLILSFYILNMIAAEYNEKGMKINDEKLYKQCVSISDDNELSPTEKKTAILLWTFPAVIMSGIFLLVIYCNLSDMIHVHISSRTYWTQFIQIVPRLMAGFIVIFLFLGSLFSLISKSFLVDYSVSKIPNLNVMRRVMIDGQNYYECCFSAGEGTYTGYVFRGADLIDTEHGLKLSCDDNIENIIDKNHIIDEKNIPDVEISDNENKTQINNENQTGNV